MYFVQKENNDIVRFSEKNKAILYAKKLYNNGFFGVGIGKNKVNNKYTFLPLQFFV